MNLAKIDLNLLVIFHALYEAQQVTLAAQTVGLTQPAVSNALARLRVLYDDALFVRVGNVMQPTPRARELARPVEAVLSQIDRTLRPAAFDPEGSRRTIRIGTIDSLEITVIAPLVGRLRASAPRVKVLSRRVAAIFELPRAELDRGTLDFALGPFPLPPAPASGISGQLLFEDRIVCIVKKAAIPRRHITTNRFLRSEHVAIFYPGEGLGLVDRILAQHKMTRNVVLMVPHFFSAAMAVASSHCISTIPESLAKMLAAPLGLSILECPIPMPSLSIGLFWHMRNNHEPANVWARNQIIQAAR